MRNDALRNDALRNAIAAALATVFLTVALVGCKSAPKMAWWKSGDGAENTALANSAPSLPADVAKQAESLASSSPSINMLAPAITMTAAPAASGKAAPYSTSTPLNVASTPSMPPTIPFGANTPIASSAETASTPPAAYPTTGASSYVETTAPVMAAIVPTQPRVGSQKYADSLGSTNPYDPSAVPPAKTMASAASATSPTTPKLNADRYGTSSLATNVPATGFPPTSSPAYQAPNYRASIAPPVATTTLSPSGSNRYENIQNAAAPSTRSSLAVSPARLDATKPASVYGSPAAAGLTGGRYASAAPPTMPNIPQVVPATAVPVSTAPAISSAPSVASAPAYRPGGTASYQSTRSILSAVEIASRPQESKQPESTTPSSTLGPVQAPRYR